MTKSMESIDTISTKLHFLEANLFKKVTNLIFIKHDSVKENKPGHCESGLALVTSNSYPRTDDPE